MKKIKHWLYATTVHIILPLPLAIFEVMAVLSPRRSPECSYAYSMVSKLRTAIQNADSLLHVA